jgi:hypothetical protein
MAQSIRLKSGTGQLQYLAQHCYNSVTQIKRLGIDVFPFLFDDFMLSRIFSLANVNFIQQPFSLYHMLNKKNILYCK